MADNWTDIDLTPLPHEEEIDIDARAFAVMQEYRSKCTLTEQQIADAAGISRTTVTKYFNSDQKDPNFKTVVKIWRGMGYDTSVFFSEVFGVRSTDNVSDVADRIAAEAGISAKCEYLERDNKRLLDIIQDRQRENAYHKSEIARLVDENESDLARQAEEYDRLIAEKERENRRLFVALWVAVGAMVAILTGLTALIVHDLGNPDAGWFRAVQAAGESLRSVVWNL